jgi:protein-S-isoprenylcysteine O-methyltransferase Ste14
MREPRGRSVLLLRDWAFRISLATIWFSFAHAHIMRWHETGEARGVGSIAVETVVAVLFLTRRAPIETSDRFVAWAATIVGTFGPLLLRPTSEGGGGSEAALVLQLVGASFSVLSLFAIGRSFGLVAANRGIRTHGPYGLVRHPVYLGYLVTNTGYVLENPSLRNLAVVAGATLAQLVRISCEEEVLSRDAVYGRYRARVRFRLIPYLY